MSKATYHRLDIAARQLETAVILFLSGRNLYSAITLAGAASGILSQLVMNRGSETFVDYARRVHNLLNGFTPPREKFNKRINDSMGINALKHHAPTDPPSIDLDLEKAAEEAISKAMLDYIELKGQQDPFILAFLNRMWLTKDGPNLMTKFNATPNKIFRRTS